MCVWLSMCTTKQLVSGMKNVLEFARQILPYYCCRIERRCFFATTTTATTIIDSPGLLSWIMNERTSELQEDSRSGKLNLFILARSS